MICERIHFKGYRNISDEMVDFSPGVNLILGNNAQGKTNLLEGICLFSSGKSFRGAKDSELIHFNEQIAQIELTFSDHDREQTMSFTVSKDGKKICKKNGVFLHKISSFIGNFRAILFFPEHLSLIKDGPHKRRNFIDLSLSQIKPSYLSNLQSYRTLLMQRNALIKESYNNKAYFFQMNEIWSKQLAEKNALITLDRIAYIKRLEEKIFDIFSEMTEGKEKVKIRYKSSFGSLEKGISKEDLCNFFEKQLMENAEKELRDGTTLFGIHRDDMDLFLNEKDSRKFASQGQQRSLALALKMGEGILSKEVTGEEPVYLLDDVMSELDEKRQNYLLNSIKGKQVIITTCGNPEIQAISDVRIFKVENGTYRRIREG